MPFNSKQQLAQYSDKSVTSAAGKARDCGLTEHTCSFIRQTVHRQKPVNQHGCVGYVRFPTGCGKFQNLSQRTYSSDSGFRSLL